jgi:hypothetical protein
MEWTEIELAGIRPLHFKGRRVGTAERRDAWDSRIDSLMLRFDTGAHAELRAAVDVSERLANPRVFVIEGTSPDTFLLFGGERMYLVSTNGEVKSEFATFREWGYEEYWVTDIIQQQAAIVIIYESGVLMIDEALQVRWHKFKYFMMTSSLSKEALSNSVATARKNGSFASKTAASAQKVWHGPCVIPVRFNAERRKDGRFSSHRAQKGPSRPAIFAGRTRLPAAAWRPKWLVRSGSARTLADTTSSPMC